MIHFQICMILKLVHIVQSLSFWARAQNVLGFWKDVAWALWKMGTQALDQYSQ